MPPTLASSKVPPERKNTLGLGSKIENRLLQTSGLRTIEGMNVRVSLDENQELLFTRVGEALKLIQAYDANLMARMQRSGITIWIPGWYPGRGAYEADLSVCVLSSIHVLSSGSPPVALAGTIVHEMIHARTWMPPCATDAFARARVERMAFEGERAFLQKLPASSELVRETEDFLLADPTNWTMRATAQAKIRVLIRATLPVWLARPAEWLLDIFRP